MTFEGTKVGPVRPMLAADPPGPPLPPTPDSSIGYMVEEDITTTMTMTILPTTTAYILATTIITTATVVHKNWPFIV